MEKHIKFIWDYYGEPALKTAEHHKIHLREFAEAKNIDTESAGCEKISDTRAIAFLLLDESEALKLKDVLRPNRAIVLRN